MGLNNLKYEIYVHLKNEWVRKQSLGGNIITKYQNNQLSFISSLN